MPVSYADLEIRILEEQARGYPVEITLDNEQEYPRGYLDPARMPQVPTASPEEDGERLFEWLFADRRLRDAWNVLRGQQAQRRIRLRIALGASRQNVLTMFLRRGLTLTAISLVLGLPLAVMINRALISGEFYGADPYHPVIYFGAVTVLVSATFFGSYLPARRAARLDPMGALRYE